MSGDSSVTSFLNLEKLRRYSKNFLNLDKVPNKVLPKEPMFIYRKTPSFGDSVVKKVLDQPQRPKMFWDRKGFYACRRCKACQQTTHSRGLSTFTSAANGREFDIKDFISSSSRHVVYALQWPCGLMYIDRTKRTLAKRV